MSWKYPSKKEIYVFVSSVEKISEADKEKTNKTIEKSHRTYLTKHHLSPRSKEAKKYHEVLLIRHRARLAIQKGLV